MTEAPVGLPSSLLSRLPTATPKVATHPSGRHGSTLQGLLVAGQKANRLEATPNRRVATQYGLNEASVRRHRAEHLAAKVVKAQAGRDLLESESLAEQINTLRRRVDILFTDATELLQKSKDGGDSKVALQAINSARALRFRIQGVDARPCRACRPAQQRSATLSVYGLIGVG
jgi:hypothetical protein